MSKGNNVIANRSTILGIRKLAALGCKTGALHSSRVYKFSYNIKIETNNNIT